MVWQAYNAAFSELPCVLPADPEPGTRHAYHLYTPLVEPGRIGQSRDWVLNALNAENIGAGVHYFPLHQHPYYRKTFGWKLGDFPTAERIGAQTLSLPLSAGLTEKDVADVILAFKKILRGSD